MEKINVSVAIATYNGEMFLKEQIDSILKNLKENDEIIISDDGSTDNTLNILKKYNDRRIKIYNGPKQGVKKNFENAISKCNGKYIFLSDQDDIWKENKVNEIMKLFYYNDKVDLILHDAEVFDSDSSSILYSSFMKYRKSESGFIKNIIKNSYIGCCMAFKKDIVKYINPIPNNIDMHDQWIGLIVEKKGKTLLCNEILIKYRRHKNNVSSLKHYKISKMIKNRIILLKELYKRWKEIKDE